MKKTKKLLSVVVALTLILTMSFATVISNAATKPSKLYVKAATGTIYIGETTKVSVYKVKPIKASKAVTFATSNKKIATVTSKGVVKGIAPGTVKITAKSKYNKKVTASVKITVKNGKRPVVNKTKKTVSIKVTANSKFFDESKPAISHLITSSCDTEGQKENALFDTKTKPLDVYDALQSIGATAWSSTKETTFDTGEKLSDEKVRNAADSANYSKLNIAIYDGDKFVGNIEDVVNYEYKGTGTKPADPVAMAFSGNKVNQGKWNSGCVACLFSCYAGITSNENIGIGTTSETENYFTVNTAKLEAGKTYTAVFTIENVITASKLNSNLKSYTVLDVRAKDDYNKGHIKNAVSADVAALVKSGDEATALKNVKAAIKGKSANTKYVLACYSGNKYANAAKRLLVEQGVASDKIIILGDDNGNIGSNGGMKAWNKLYSTVNSDGKTVWGGKYVVENPNGANTWEGCVVDFDKKTISVAAEVNDEIHMNDNPDQTHHILVNKEGGNGDKCILPTDANAMGLYYGLLALGGTPDNSWTSSNHPAGFFTKGSDVEETVVINDTVNGAVPGTYTLDQIIKNIDGSKYQVAMKFTGNVPQFDETKYPVSKNVSGCMSCTFSCWIGVVSNSAYGYGTQEQYPIREVLGNGGASATVVFRLK